MASLAASVANTIALPARSATIVRIAGLAGLCAATLVAPALLLVWMPIVLGVPHIASDVRYLVLPLPRRQVVVALVACAAVVALKAASLATGVPLLRAEVVVVAAWLLVALALDRPRRPAGGRSHALARHALDVSPLPHATSRDRRIWLVAVFAALAIVALPMQFAIIAAFAHNAIAVVAWLVVGRPDRRHALAIIAAIAAAVALLLLVGPAVASATGGDTTRWLTIDRAASLMFGGVPLPTARGLLIAFAFMQAVHYAIWLDWIPRARDGGGPAIPSVHRSYGAPAGRIAASSALPLEQCTDGIRNIPPSALPLEQRTDGIRGIPRAMIGSIVVAATTVVVLGAAVVDAAWTRTTYLALASFHMYLELVVLAAIVAGRKSRVLATHVAARRVARSMR